MATVGRTRLIRDTEDSGDLVRQLNERFREHDRRRAVDTPSTVNDTSLLPEATKNKGKVRFDKSTNTFVFSDGTTWLTLQTSAITYAVPTTTFGATAAVGVATTTIRSDATFVYPTALMSSANSKTLTLTDDGSRQVLTGTLGILEIAPSANLRVTGHMAVNDDPTTASVLYGLEFWSQTSGFQQVMLFDSAVNSSAGTGTFYGVRGQTRTFSGKGGGAALVGLRGLGNFAFGSGVACAKLTGVEAAVQISGDDGTNSITNDARCINLMIDGAGNQLASVTNLYGVECQALTFGTNRYGAYFNGTSTGTPTNAYGVYSASHGVGTNRWGGYFSNKVECNASDFICGTAAKGLISKDAQGTPEYWRTYVDSAGATVGGAQFSVSNLGVLTVTRTGVPTGTLRLQIADVGTAAPLT